MKNDIKLSQELTTKELKNKIKNLTPVPVKKTTKKEVEKDITLILPFSVEEIVASCSKDIKYYKQYNDTLWTYVIVLTLIVIGEYIVFFLK
jgi:hypothetical protein